VGALTLGLATFAFPGSAALRWSALGLALFIVWKHRANLERLARGAESRLGSRRA
jgi:glycerol-3-phosphate acyltransferase PlsY